MILLYMLLHNQDRLITLLILKNQWQIVGKSGNAISVIRYLIVGIY
jgi:hypothetical protein